MADQMVLKTQQWLNTTYGSKTGFGSVSENGRTGWDTINALIRALQIELGITATANNFGAGTRSRFKNRWPNGISKNDSSSNVHGIIQGALWCKGYPAEYGGITTKFTDNVASSIRDLKSDIGLSSSSSTIDLELMMALLSMKQFKLLSAYGGKDSIRTIQREINQRYKAYTGIVPTDGLYGREMNTALIQVLQAIEGFTPAEATGNFGNGTRSRLQTISGGSSQWVWLGTAALVCNGIGQNAVKTWDPSIPDAIKGFQNTYKIPQTGKFDPTTWMSLLTSKGDPKRACVACDTRFEITDELAKHLKADGYQIVGRYLSEPGQENTAEADYFKALRTGELERIVRHGLKYFPIFQEYSTKLRHFSAENGALHARKAQAAAQRLGVPPTIIYFAVDYDATDPEVTSNILPYFRAVSANLGGGYGVGIYASRNICARVAEAGYSVASFVSDMSTGFSGNLGFSIPKNWVFDQFHEISGYRGKWDLDRVAYSGRVSACASVLSPIPVPTPDPDPATPDTDPLLQWVSTTENECINAFSGTFNTIAPYRSSIGEFILEWLRKPEYWGDKYLGLWRIYTPEIPTPEDLQSARLVCANKCEDQPRIKGTLPRRDIAHMAATALGYLTWGFADNNSTYTLGDLGGWPLDLLQIWGNYRREGSASDLAKWLYKHLGHISNGKGFGYDDVLADADAWLIAHKMKNNPSEISLSEAMRDTFSSSESNRIKRFYRDRFGASADNLVSAFQGLANGIDIWVFEDFSYGKQKLLSASGADKLPTKNEAATLARGYAAFLANPHR